MANRRECEGGWIEEYMRYVEKDESPDLYKKWAAVCTISGALEKRTWVMWQKRIYSNFFIILVAPSGVCRKSGAIEPVDSLLREVGLNVITGSITKEALVVKMNRDFARKVTDPETGEEVTHTPLTLIAPELTVMIGYQDTDYLDWLNSWHDCQDPFERFTKYCGEFRIRGACVSLIAGTTPVHLKEGIPSQQMLAGGFASRAMFIFESKKPLTIADPWNRPRAKESRKRLVADLRAIKEMEGKFDLVKGGALDALQEWYLKNDRENPFGSEKLSMASYCQRRFMHLLKLCMVISASHSNECVITIPHFDEAHALLLETEKKMPFTFSTMGMNTLLPIMNNIEAALASATVLSMAGLMEMTKRDITARDLDTVVNTLIRMGRAQRVMVGNVLSLEYIPPNGDEEGAGEEEGKESG